MLFLDLARMNNKLHLRVTRIVLLSASAFAIVVSFTSYFYTKSVEQKIMENALGQLFSTVEYPAQIAAYLDNEELASEVVESLLNNDIVAGSILTSRTGLNVVAKTKFTELNNSLSYPLSDPFTPSEFVGEINIQPNQVLLNERVKASALEKVLILIIQILVITVLILTLLRRALTDPIQSIAANLHNIVPGDDTNLKCPFGHERDEIGKLVSDINKLLASTRETIKQERHLRSRIESLEKHFRLIFERASAGIFLLDSNFNLTSVNQAFKKIAGIALEERRVKKQNTYLPEFFYDPDIVHDLLQDVLKNDKQTACDLRLGTLITREERWLHCLFSTVKNDDGENLIEGLVIDVTERTFQMEKILFESEHDALTKLFNRRAGEQLLNVMLNNAKKNNGQLALLLIDLDGFKLINDNFGHDAGDKVLVEISRRMQATIRKEDVLIRMGGDEFIIVFIPKEGSSDEINLFVNKLQKQFDTEIEFNSMREIKIGSSIGIALYPQDGNEVEELIAKADIAMYQAKKNGKNCSSYFNSTCS